MLFLDFDAVNIKFIKVNRLVYLMLIRWAVCVWLQCDSILCEFTTTFNMLAIVIIIMFIINLGSFGWPIPTFLNLTVLNIFLCYIIPINRKIIIVFRLGILITIYFMSCLVQLYIHWAYFHPVLSKKSISCCIIFGLAFLQFKCIRLWLSVVIQQQ